MLIKCKDCGYTCSKKDAESASKIDSRGAAAECPNCNNKVLFRLQGSRRVVYEGGFAIHYK
jgi:DNA-directed RNA polymerase subunit RPC12/RpoP